MTGRQGELFAEPEDPNAEAFKAFHRANPFVYRQLVKLARQAKMSGAKRLGARELWERLRWWARFETRDARPDFKLNNTHVPYYARLIMDQEPDLAGIFETRKQKHEKGNNE